MYEASSCFDAASCLHNDVQRGRPRGITVGASYCSGASRHMEDKPVVEFQVDKNG